uniref:Uncharacterized protein n=1 Tax=Timema tahoe TaxID=61484 RepID=A0A7R9I8S4_9NEOP|nr:unnamed protein product [Timema tahoe]
MAKEQLVMVRDKEGYIHRKCIRTCMEAEGKTILNTPNRDSNLNLVIGNLVHCKSTSMQELLVDDCKSPKLNLLSLQLSNKSEQRDFSASQLQATSTSLKGKEPSLSSSEPLRMLRLTCFCNKSSWYGSPGVKEKPLTCALLDTVENFRHVTHHFKDAHISPMGVVKTSVSISATPPPPRILAPEVGGVGPSIPKRVTTKITHHRSHYSSRRKIKQLPVILRIDGVSRVTCSHTWSQGLVQGAAAHFVTIRTVGIYFCNKALLNSTRGNVEIPQSWDICEIKRRAIYAFMNISDLEILIDTLVKYCPELRSLKFHDSQRMRPLHVSAIRKNFVHLRNVHICVDDIVTEDVDSLNIRKLSSFHNLNSISLMCSMWPKDRSCFQPIAEGCHALKHFSVGYISSLSSRSAANKILPQIVPIRPTMRVKLTAIALQSIKMRGKYVDNDAVEGPHSGEDERVVHGGECDGPNRMLCPKERMLPDMTLAALRSCRHRYVGGCPRPPVTSPWPTGTWGSPGGLGPCRGPLSVLGAL